MVENDVDVTVGKNIRRLREARDFSQAQLAERIGLDFRQQTLVKVERGERPLRLSEAIEVARVLSVEVRDLHRTVEDGTENLLQIAGMYRTVEGMYDSARQQIQQLESWRWDMRGMYERTIVDPFPAALAEGIEGYGRDDVVERCVEEARAAARLDPLTAYGKSR